MLEVVAERQPDAIAIAAPGRAVLTYRGLTRQVESGCQVLRDMGLRRTDRLALVLSPGPDMAVAILAAMHAAACAPLDPAYREPEFASYFAHVRASAVILPANAGSAARAAARRCGIRIIEFHAAEDNEGVRFSAPRACRPSPAPSPAMPEPGDTALLLRTSGTTGRPKLVPLTHANLCASARTIAATLRLGHEDRCLNVMPLFHIHGLVAALLSTLAAGGSVVCTSGFDPARFLCWAAEVAPTWYTAAPAIHQAILAERRRTAGVGARPFRFIRSCSAPLPRPVLDELENTFQAPVIEAYGMTEAAHQVCSNPLPPQVRKPGSVGRATGCEVAILDDAGRPVSNGAVGEVVIRGPGVTVAYEDGPADNAAAFRNGWFRTGDLGMVDRDGYLYLKGRLKDIINRGGEKISPREVEDALAEHPAVVQAVAFPVPHTVLGEDVAAAVVVRSNAQVAEGGLRQFAASRLADFKVPSRVVILDRLPTGATGKVARDRLAARLGVREAAPCLAPTDEVERALAEIWAPLLGAHRAIGVHENFFQLGGYSLAAARMLEQVEQRFGRRLPMSILFQAPTVAELAELIRGGTAANVPWSSLVAIRRSGARRPFFCVHGGSGNVLEFDFLARHLDPEQPFYGLQARGLDGVTPPHVRIEDMAADYVADIRAVQPDGPYLLGGVAIGGLVALEMARQLRAGGDRVPFLGLFDTYFWNAVPQRRKRPLVLCLAEYHIDHLTHLGPCDTRKATYLLQMLARPWRPGAPAAAAPEELRSPLEESLIEAAQAYAPQPYDGGVTLFLARQRECFEWPQGSMLKRVRLDPRVPEVLGAGVIEIYRVPGNHATMMHSAPHVAVVGRILRTCLDRAARIA
jgi:oxalate---CoA ligase